MHGWSGSTLAAVDDHLACQASSFRSCIWRSPKLFIEVQETSIFVPNCRHRLLQQSHPTAFTRQVLSLKMACSLRTSYPEY